VKRIVPFLLYVIAVVAGFQPMAAGQSSSAQEIPVRGYWSDPSTGLMWTAKDNGSDISWSNAMKYCQNLSLAGYSDWRLPTIDELQDIYDGSGFTPPSPNGSMPILAGKAKGGLILTGAREWSSNRVLDDRGHRTGIAWQYDFPHGKRWRYDPVGYTGSLRALCVRHP